MRRDPIHILLVEDNPADARLMEFMLAERFAALTIARAGSVAAALRALDADRNAGRTADRAPRAASPRPIDVVLLDLGLPDGQSLDTLRAVAAGAGGVPIVVLSGLADEALGVTAVREGAQDYLVKGRIEPEVLARSLGYAVERARLQERELAAEAALDESRRFIAAIADASPAILYVYDVARGVNLYNNRAFFTLLGHTDQAAATPGFIPSLRHPDDAPLLAEHHARLAASGPGDVVRGEQRLRHADGTYRWLEVHDGVITRESAGGPERITGVAVDVTERHQAEHAARESEDRFRRLADSAPVFILVFAPDGGCEHANRGWLDFTGRPLHAQLGHGWRDALLRADAPTFLAAFTGRLARRDSWRAEVRARNGRGEERWLLFSAAPRQGERGEAAGVVASAVDITDRKLAEDALRKSEEHLRHAQKLEAVGMLASGVAHDFNNLIAAIRGYASLARSSLSGGHPALESLDQVEEASRQATGVANGLLTFARKGRTERVPVAMAAAVEGAARLVRRTLPPAVRMDIDAARATDLWVRGDATQLQQVVLNLCLNARDAIAGQGLIRVAVEPVPPDPPDAPPLAVRITVADDGAGMTPDVQAHVFEPFFTTKPRGQGTGLGLPIIHGIVADHAGSVSFESAPGMGSTFTVTLPLAPAPRAVPVAGAPAARALGGSALLVEDEPFVRPLLASMLGTLGYEVLMAVTAAEALTLAPRGRAIDLLVVNERLPDGASLVRDLRARARVGGVIVVSSDPAPPHPADPDAPPDAVTHAVTHAVPYAVPGAAVLRKPFQLADLRRVLEAAASLPTQPPRAEAVP